MQTGRGNGDETGAQEVASEGQVTKVSGGSEEEEQLAKEIEQEINSDVEVQMEEEQVLQQQQNLADEEVVNLENDNLVEKKDLEDLYAALQRCIIAVQSSQVVEAQDIGILAEAQLLGKVIEAIEDKVQDEEVHDKRRNPDCSGKSDAGIR